MNLRGTYYGWISNKRNVYKRNFSETIDLKRIQGYYFFMSNINLVELSYNYPIKERNMQYAQCNGKKSLFITFKVSAVKNSKLV